MALFGIVFFCVALFLVGVGIAVGLVACLLAVGLLALGIVSSSLVLGFWSGRAATGFRAFFLQCGILAGIPAGAVCAWLGQSFFAAYGSEMPTLIYGALGGALAGVIVALALDFIVRRTHAWAANRLSQFPVSSDRASLQAAHSDP